MCVNDYKSLVSDDEIEELHAAVVIIEEVQQLNHKQHSKQYLSNHHLNLPRQPSQPAHRVKHHHPEHYPQRVHIKLFVFLLKTIG